MVKKKDEEPKKKPTTPIDTRKGQKRKTGSKVGRPRIRTDRIGLREQLGRPSGYIQKLHDKMIYECMRLQRTVEHAAEFLGVHLDTLYDWRKKYPSFSEAWISGKHAMHDMAQVTLSERMVGYTVVEEGEKVVGGEVITLKSKKELPPDVRAAEIVLSRWDRMLDRELKKESGLSDDEMLEAIREGIRAKMQEKLEAKTKEDD